MQNTAHRVFCYQYSLWAVNLKGKLAAERSADYAVALAKFTPGHWRSSLVLISAGQCGSY